MLLVTVGDGISLPTAANLASYAGLAPTTESSVLPGRKSATLEAWLRRHPSIEAGCRDGSTTYAEAVRRALPDALRISDRRQLWHNLAEAVRKEVGAPAPAGRKRVPSPPGDQGTGLHRQLERARPLHRPGPRQGRPTRTSPRRPAPLLAHPPRAPQRPPAGTHRGRPHHLQRDDRSGRPHPPLRRAAGSRRRQGRPAEHLDHLVQAEDLPHLRVFTQGLKAGFAPAVAREASHAFGAARRPLSSVAR